MSFPSPVLSPEDGHRPAHLCSPGHAALKSWGSLLGGRSLSLGLRGVSIPVRLHSGDRPGPPTPLPAAPAAPGCPGRCGNCPPQSCAPTSFPEERPFLLPARRGRPGQRPLQPQRPDAVGPGQQVERARPSWDHRGDAGGDRLGARAR